MKNYGIKRRDIFVNAARFLSFKKNELKHSLILLVKTKGKYIIVYEALVCHEHE